MNISFEYAYFMTKAVYFLLFHVFCGSEVGTEASNRQALPIMIWRYKQRYEV